MLQLQAHASEGGFGLPDDDRRVVDVRRTLATLTADFKRLTELQEVRSAAWRTASAALQAVEEWLRDGRPHGTTLEDFEGPKPTLNKGETVIDAIERHRRRGRELKADLNRIQSSCYPSSYCKAQARAQVEQLVQRGAPDVANLIEHDREIAWPTQQLQATIYNAQPGATGFTEVTDTLALVAWTFKDALIAALDRPGASIPHARCFWKPLMLRR